MFIKDIASSAALCKPPPQKKKTEQSSCLKEQWEKSGRGKWLLSQIWQNLMGMITEVCIKCNGVRDWSIGWNSSIEEFGLDIYYYLLSF